MDYLLISSETDPASQNLKKHVENYGYSVFNIEKKSTQTNYSEFPQSEMYIFLSKHASESKKPTLTVHTPGNLTDDNSHGGNPEEISPCNPVFNTLMLQNMNKYNEMEEYQELGFDVSFEVLHHGPTDLKAPSAFVEIGSSEEQWQIDDAAEIITNSLIDTLNSIQNSEYDEKEKIIGIGGGHYSPKFTKLALREEYYVGYLTPKHAKLSENILNQLTSKQEFDFVGIDWKGLYGEDKRKYAEFFDENDISWQRV
ncbi:D-aminoacyl-tRNA deacylase [Methanococcus maripaludis]|uniref:D-aminoacyl-tRNA deacylase n=1 Tax=Methanococcus maripaludis TaxID=39152 RepID=A0A7J9NSG5_METMI|nr:D-aminoacyl-tRNA deacylase [Methanococcus maripaludis]MBA2850609.1 D-aminoacyl-tRNA deacylase [Methanococcus maripaludis]